MGKIYLESLSNTPYERNGDKYMGQLKLESTPST